MSVLFGSSKLCKILVVTLLERCNTRRYVTTSDDKVATSRDMTTMLRRVTTSRVVINGRPLVHTHCAHLSDSHMPGPTVHLPARSCHLAVDLPYDVFELLREGNLTARGNTDMPAEYHVDLARNLVEARGLSVPDRVTLAATMDHVLAFSGTYLNRRAADDAHKVLAVVDMSFTAGPVAKMCLECQRPLSDLRPVKGAKTYFYPLYQCGQRGTAYTRECTHCKLTYAVSGYESTATHGTRTGIKWQYPAQLNHPRWLELTRDTVVDLQLLKLHEGVLQFDQGSFQSVARINNYMAGACMRE